MVEVRGDFGRDAEDGGEAAQAVARRRGEKVTRGGVLPLDGAPVGNAVDFVRGHAFTGDLADVVEALLRVVCDHGRALGDVVRELGRLAGGLSDLAGAVVRVRACVGLAELIMRHGGDVCAVEVPADADNAGIDPAFCVHAAAPRADHPGVHATFLPESYARIIALQRWAADKILISCQPRKPLLDGNNRPVM